MVKPAPLVNPWTDGGRERTDVLVNGVGVKDYRFGTDVSISSGETRTLIQPVDPARSIHPQPTGYRFTLHSDLVSHPPIGLISCLSCSRCHLLVFFVLRNLVESYKYYAKMSADYTTIC